MTPMHAAATRGNIEIVDYLDKAHPELYNVKTTRGVSSVPVILVWTFVW